MFRVPGVNPGQVAGSILSAPPTQPVAAQPLSLKNLITEARATLNDPNSDPVQVASLTTQLNEKGIPVEALTTNVAAQPLVAGEEAAKKPPVQVAEHFKVDLPPSVNKEDAKKIQEAVAAAGHHVTAKGEVSPEVANAAAEKGDVALRAVLDAEDNFENQIKAVTTGGNLEGATSKNYNELAKEYLGLDKDEPDIPEWAAPIFLFGLNLMKAPVSTATRDTGLGGLLADIGKAGEVGFASFATERARKRKERLAIGQMALDLKKSDDATRVSAAKARITSTQWMANYLQRLETEERLIGTEDR